MEQKLVIIIKCTEENFSVEIDRENMDTIEALGYLKVIEEELMAELKNGQPNK